MIVAVIAAVLGASACRAPSAAPVAAVADGVAIALYARSGSDGYSVVDDRRWVEVTGDHVVLDRVEPAAALPSLVIEPLAGGALDIGACLRERTASAALRCTVHARPGRYLIRLLYVSPQLRYRSQHEATVTEPARATLWSRFSIFTPDWHTVAEVTLYDGVPGGEPAPREIARGRIALDGRTAMLDVPRHDVAARLRRVYDGALRRNDGPDPRDPRWGRESQSAVWVWLELPGLGDPGLAPGPVHVRVAVPGEASGEVDVPPLLRRSRGGELRLPLWVDDQLIGKRERWTEAPDDTVLSDRFAIAVTNHGDTGREVWIEEALRPGARRSLAHAWPRAPELGHHLLRLALVVAPGATERARFAIDYER
jgi:hypothetical protein